MEELEQCFVWPHDFENCYQWQKKSGLREEQVIDATAITAVVVIASSFNEKPSVTAVISEAMFEGSHWKVVQSHCSDDAAVASIEMKMMQQNFALTRSCCLEAN